MRQRWLGLYTGAVIQTLVFFLLMRGREELPTYKSQWLIRILKWFSLTVRFHGPGMSLVLFGFVATANKNQTCLWLEFVPLSSRFNLQPLPSRQPDTWNCARSKLDELVFQLIQLQKVITKKWALLIKYRGNLKAPPAMPLPPGYKALLTN